MNQILIYILISILAMTTLFQVGVVQIFTHDILNDRKRYRNRKKKYSSTIFSLYILMLKHISNYFSQLKSTTFIQEQIIYPINFDQYITNKTYDDTQNPLYIKFSLSQTPYIEQS